VCYAESIVHAIELLPCPKEVLATGEDKPRIAASVTTINVEIWTQELFRETIQPTLLISSKRSAFTIVTVDKSPP
jgi:hypothetical protein